MIVLTMVLIRRLRPKEPIPEFKSREEEARFWDTHDLADYWDEFKSVKVRFAKNLSEGITVRFDPETLAKRNYSPGRYGFGVGVHETASAVMGR